jgi:hypothetical protein
MTTSDIDPLKIALLDDVYRGLIGSHELSSILIYKGARVLKEMLVTTRFSLDIDVTLRPEFVAIHKMIEDQKHYLTALISASLRTHFESAAAVRYTLLDVDLKVRPGREVPDNWRMFAAIIHVRDALAATTPDLVAQIDISIGEQFSDSAIANITVDDHKIYVYSLSRIAGEKLRAFLSCLPTYRGKLKLPTTVERRAKDLFDLSKIEREHRLSDGEFWHQAAREFVLACEFRRIDCAGLVSFLDDWKVTAIEYERDTRLSDVPLTHARQTLETIVTFLTDHHYLPLRNP